MTKVIIIGASGHAKVIADIVVKSGDELLGFLDDSEPHASGIANPVLGKVADCINYPEVSFIIGIGDNKIRKSIAEKYSGLKYYTAIHPNSVIACGTEIETGTCVMANAVVNPAAKIGRHCIINTSAVVEHDCVVADYVHISPGAVLCGTVNVGESAHIGAGAVVRNNINIPAECTVGVGTAVIKDIEKSGVYAGVPARELYK